MWYYVRSSYLSSSSASSHVAEKACSNVFTQQDRQLLLRPLSPAIRVSFKWAKLRENTEKRNPRLFLPEQNSLPGIRQYLRNITAGLSPPSECLELSCDEGMSPPFSWDLTTSVTFHFHLARFFCLKRNLRIARGWGWFSERGFGSALLAADAGKYEGSFHKKPNLHHLYIWVKHTVGEILCKNERFRRVYVQVVQKVSSFLGCLF